MAVAIAVALAAPTRADDEQTTFSSRTSPLSAGTVVGAWAQFGQSGNHVVTTTGANGEGTTITFVAGVITGWLDVKGAAVLLASRIVAVDQRRVTAGRSHVELSARYRVKGRPWTAWSTRSYRLAEAAGETMIAPPAGGVGIVVPACSCKVQAQWRMTGTLTGTLTHYLQGAVQIAPDQQ